MKNLIILSKCVLSFVSLLLTHYVFSLIPTDITCNLGMSYVALVVGLAQVGMGAYQYFNEKEKEKDLNKQSQSYVAKMRQQLNSLTNPYAALQTSDRGERLALDKSNQAMAGLTSNLYSAEQTAQATNLVRAQQRQALEVGANLSQREEATAQVRAQGEADLQKAKTEGETAILEGQLQGAQNQITASQMNQQTALSGIAQGAGNVAEGAISSSNLYKDANQLEDATKIYNQLDQTKLPAGMTEEDAINRLKEMKRKERKSWTGMDQNWDDFDYTIFD
jgi:ABC-type uncharacterized transport system permease subunit